MSAILVTVIDEVIIDRDPPEITRWFPQMETDDGSNRYSLFLAVDFQKVGENPIERLSSWMKKFQENRKEVEGKCSILGAMVCLVLSHHDEISDSRDLSRLITEGFSPWTKEKPFYRDDQPFIDAFREDLRNISPSLREGISIPEDESIAPPPDPDPDDPIYKETRDFLASEQFCWPREAIQELLGQKIDQSLGSCNNSTTDILDEGLDMRTFGEFIKQKRIGLKRTLREFCQEHKFDPGNYSKLERGILSPPHDNNKLTKYADSLGIVRNSSDWIEFSDLAAIAQHRIPDDLLNDDKILGRLPVLFRAIRDPKKLDEFIEMIRKS